MNRYDNDKIFKPCNLKYYSIRRLKRFLKDKKTSQYHKEIILKSFKLVTTTKNYDEEIEKLIKSAYN